MDALTVISCSFLPPRHGSLVHPKGMDNGLWRAAIGEQDHHRENHCRWFSQSLKHRPLMCAACPPTHFAFISLAFLSMADDVASVEFPSCRAVHIRAK